MKNFKKNFLLLIIMFPVIMLLSSVFAEKQIAANITISCTTNQDCQFPCVTGSCLSNGTCGQSSYRTAGTACLTDTIPNGVCNDVGSCLAIQGPPIPSLTPVCTKNGSTCTDASRSYSARCSLSVNNQYLTYDCTSPSGSCAPTTYTCSDTTATCNNTATGIICVPPTPACAKKNNICSDSYGEANADTCDAASNVGSEFFCGSDNYCHAATIFCPSETVCAVNSSTGHVDCNSIPPTSTPATGLKWKQIALCPAPTSAPAPTPTPTLTPTPTPIQPPVSTDSCSISEKNASCSSCLADLSCAWTAEGNNPDLNIHPCNSKSKFPISAGKTCPAGQANWFTKDCHINDCREISPTPTPTPTTSTSIPCTPEDSVFCLGDAITVCTNGKPVSSACPSGQTCTPNAAGLPQCGLPASLTPTPIAGDTIIQLHSNAFTRLFTNRKNELIARKNKDLTMYLYNSTADTKTSTEFKKISSATPLASSVENSLSFNFGKVLAGTYKILLKSPKYLRTVVVSNQAISGIGQTITIAALSKNLADGAGDVDDNNILDIRDYNIILGCSGAKKDAPTCIDKDAADLNDDGIIDGIDHNIFITSLSFTTREGD